MDDYIVNHESCVDVTVVVWVYFEAGGLLVWCEREIAGENVKGRKGRTRGGRQSKRRW
jgi:hypothetical protein